MQKPITQMEKLESKIVKLSDGEANQFAKLAEIPAEVLICNVDMFKKLSCDEVRQTLNNIKPLRAGGKWQRRADFNSSVMGAIRRKNKHRLQSPYENPKFRKVGDDQAELMWLTNELKKAHETIKQKDRQIEELEKKVEQQSDDIFEKGARLEAIEEEAADLLQRSTIKLKQIFNLAEE